VAVLKDDWVTLPERKTRIPESKIGPVWSGDVRRGALVLVLSLMKSACRRD
jgi:hypothetical protein